VTKTLGVSVAPSAARLTGSLRDIGYDFPSAVADLVDNSIAAGATRVELVIEYDGAESRVMIADDGAGMTPNGVIEALRFGTRRAYGPNELGRYGLGLKTASLSQCRRVTVLTRTGTRRVVSRRLDLDIIEEFDDWLIVEPPRDSLLSRARGLLGDGHGTVVVWEALDRVLQESRPEGGWARRRVERLAERTAEHLSVAFHRFLEGDGRPRVDMIVNGQKLEPWNPFAPGEPGTVQLAPQRFELEVGRAQGVVTLQRFVLPPRNRFSSAAEFERLSGPGKWNRQQGLYIYRAGRLVQAGGWGGLRGIDEHLKLARAAVDFETDLDTAFTINVAKMRVSVPAQLKQMLERPVHELCVLADDTYRKAAPSRSRDETADLPLARQGGSVGALFALKAAAMAAGEYDALLRIIERLTETSPDVAAALGVAQPDMAAG
jgi:hypothetical protein